MAINRIALKNFKCFKEVDVSLSKITLLTGENSSGKSSLLYGLLCVFQSKDFPFYLSPNGKYINMGGFEEISFNHLQSNKIDINISVNDDLGEEYNFNTSWIIDPNLKLPKLSYLRLTTKILDFEIKLDGPYIINFSFDNEKFYEAHRKRVVEDENNYDNSNPVHSLIKAFNNVKPLEVQNIKNLSLESLDELAKKLHDTDNIAAWVQIENCLRVLQAIDNNLNFISSFRSVPERTYYQKTRAEKIGKYGESYIDQIFQWENEKSEKFKELKTILKNLNLLNTIKTKQLKGGRFELSVRVKNKSIWASLADVGFGISQFLPIIVADLQLADNSILLVAEPEIHLHPSVQAELVDYLVKQVNNSDKRYIIETHSEYLLNRIRLSIVKGEIEPYDVSAFYLENSIDGSKAHQIEFRKNGQIEGAPKGFFDTYMMDVLDIALHAEG